MYDEDETRRAERLAAYEREQDKLHVALAGALIVFLGTGAIAVWGFWGYLNTGAWPTITLRAIFGWSFQSDMIGWQNIVNWLLDLWLGAYTLAIGFLFIFGANSD